MRYNWVGLSLSSCAHKYPGFNLLSAIPEVSLIRGLIVLIIGMLSNITVNREGGGSDASEVLRQLLKLENKTSAIIRVKYFFKLKSFKDVFRLSLI